MKRNVLGLFAVVLAVAFSSFSAKFTTYHVTDETSNQYLIEVSPSSDPCQFGDKLCKFTTSESVNLGWRDKTEIDPIVATASDVTTLRQ